MKRRGFIGLVLGALGLAVIPKKTKPEPFLIHEVDAGTTIYIDPAIEGYDETVVHWFKVRNQQLEELMTLSMKNAGNAVREQIARDFLHGDQQRVGMP